PVMPQVEWFGSRGESGLWRGCRTRDWRGAPCPSIPRRPGPDRRHAGAGGSAVKAGGPRPPRSRGKARFWTFGTRVARVRRMRSQPDSLSVEGSALSRRRRPARALGWLLGAAGAAMMDQAMAVQGPPVPEGIWVRPGYELSVAVT